MKPLISFSREIRLRMNSLSKTLIALIGICLLVSVGNLGIHQVQATPAPAGVVYSVPITLTNTQSVATPAPFQQMITVDSSSYSSYEAPDLQNIEFFDSNGTVIPSWLESGNSNTSTTTVYWLELTDGIPANSSITVYRGFASTTTSLFDNQTTGEAPQLSPVYGEYDNGAQIFPVYANFGGSALPTDWSLQGSASFVPGTGVETVNSGGSEEGAIVDNASMTSTDIAIEASTSYFGSADEQSTGFYSSGTLSGGGGGGGLAPNGYSVSFDPWYGTTGYLIYQGTGNGMPTSTSSPSASGYSFQQIAITPTSIQWNSASGSSVYYAPPYSQLTTFLTYNGAVSNSYGGLFFSSTTGFGTSTQYIYWLRVRALPPNGVMPGVSTNTTVASSANPSVYGQSVTFTATVTDTAATGTVTFQDGGAALGSPALSNGTATYTTSTLSVGSHTITAVYSGDSNFAGSTSSALTQTVTQASTTTGISSSVNPSAYGQSVTFTATVTGTGATGTVTFQDGGATLGSTTLSNGTATYTTSTLSVGSHTITAIYSGDTNFAGSTSSALTQTVTKASTVSIASVSSKYGGKVKLSATLTSGGSPLSGKTITFTINGAVMGSASTNKSGVATLTGVSLAGISAGTYSGAITASFAGDTNYGASSGSADLTITSGPNQTPGYAFNGAYATYQISYAYSGFNYGGITVNGGSLNGGVTFKVSNVEAAAQTINVTTSYSGYLAELNMVTDNVSASFSDPSPFPAESQSDLQMLNQGQVPPDMVGATVKTGVSVSVPAGSFKTDEITNTNADTVCWVETSSGLIVKQTGAFFDLPSGTMELQSTNIATAKSFPFIIVIAIVVAAILIAGVASLLVLRRRKLKESAVAVAEPVMETAPRSVPMAQNSGGVSSDPTQRLQRLKGMLDAGVISQQDYDEQKKKILDEYTK